MWTRRKFMVSGTLLPWALGLTDAQAASAANAIPVGLEMYSVREALARDPTRAVRAVAAMGYQGLEFYAPYFAWSEAQAKDMRNLLDELKLRCFSTHNDNDYFRGDKLQHARELNLILGSKYMVMASSHGEPGLDRWREVADTALGFVQRFVKP